MQLEHLLILENSGKIFSAENRTGEKNFKNPCLDIDHFWTNVHCSPELAHCSPKLAHCSPELAHFNPELAHFSSSCQVAQFDTSRPSHLHIGTTCDEYFANVLDLSITHHHDQQAVHKQRLHIYNSFWVLN